MRYIVKEFSGRRWHVVRSFDNEADAAACAQQLGRNAKVFPIKRNPQ